MCWFFIQISWTKWSFSNKSRIGITVNDNNVICPFHRANIGIALRSSKLCDHPDHQRKSNSGLRALTKDEYNSLSIWYPNKAFPFGTLMCTKEKGISKFCTNAGSQHCKWMQFQWQLSTRCVQNNPWRSENIRWFIFNFGKQSCQT